MMIYRNKYYLHSGNAKQLLSAIAECKENIEVSLDLNKTVQSLSVNDDHVVFDHNNKLTRADLLSILK